jgi:hypothetical protein
MHLTPFAIALSAVILAAGDAGEASADAGAASRRPEVVELAPMAVPNLPAPDRTLESDVLDALRAWNPKARASALSTWAAAIANGSPTRARAIWLASIGSVESKFVPWVLDFTCNRMAGYRACDNGRAVGPFQIWDDALVGASPESHVRRAYERLERQGEQAWSTWRAARAQADQWLQRHP